MEYRKLYKVNIYRIFIALITLVTLNGTFAFATITTDSSAGSDKVKYQPLRELQWSGYVRTYFYYRNLEEKYFDTPGGQNWFSANGGYNEPFMRLTASGHPTSKTSFEVQYTFDNLLTGQGSVDQSGKSGKISLPLQTLKFAGTHSSKYGNFSMQAGGIFFYTMTSLTIGGYSTRDDPFERLPWEGETNSKKRYEKYYYEGSVRRAYQSRFGSNPIQGFVLEGNSLPYGLGGIALIGKSTSSGGYQSWLESSPRKLQAYRLYKNFSGQLFGVNYMNSFGYTDQFLRQKETVNIITVDSRIKLKEITITAELGMGNYMNPILAKSGGELINASFSTTKKLTYLPLLFHVYQISPNVVNPNSELVNSSVASLANNRFNDSTQFSNSPGAITDAGQLTNNRRGLNLTLQKDIKNFKIGITLCAAEEIENRFDAITFQHRLNKVARSRFNFFSTKVGPYQRISSIYLTTFETIKINTTDQYKKRFNTLDLNLRYKFRLFHKDILVFNYTNYNSVQRALSVIPVGTSKAFINYLYNEITTMASLNSKVTAIGLFGYEKVTGSKETELAPNGNPINQVGYAYGAGLDFDIKERAGIYIRYRIFSHKDVNFTLDKFRGQEASVEFKVFF